MKTCHNYLLLILLIAFSSVAHGQSKEDAIPLLKAGIALHDEGKYPEAIAKYKEALKIDPDNINAQYEISYTMSVSGKAQDAIPYLEKLVAAKAMPEAFDLLGSTYDDADKFDKAEACYKAGMEAFPKFQRLHFNMSLAYLRQKKYPEAEIYAIEAIKLDPKHASSQRAYAMATIGEDKRLCALLAFCGFILLEPQTERSKEAYDYIDRIFKASADQKNILMTTDKATNSISPMSFSESSIVLAASANKALESKNIGTAQERLTNELKMVFSTTGKQSEKVTNKDFFWNFYADYFGKLAATENMEAFVRLISLSVAQQENLQWFKDNNPKLSALDAWVTTTKREF